jgi:hypothetical protein
MRTRHAAALLLLLAAGAASQAPTGAPAGIASRPLPLNAEDPAQTRAGRLAYMGGIALTSPDRRFGGLSGMRFLGDGGVLAISDDGDWLRFRLEERDGRLVARSSRTEPFSSPMNASTGSRPMRPTVRRRASSPFRIATG